MATNEIRIERPDAPMAGTLIMIAAMEALEEAGIQNPSALEAKADETGKPEFVIRVTSEEIAKVLREGLPKKGYKILE